MIRSSIVSLIVAGLTAGCANVQPVLSGGYYCITGTELSCPEHEGNGDCQLCPRSAAAPLAAATDPATATALPARPD
jgi:hypothetical protein